VILTIDTTHPLNDADRAVLAALLADTPAPIRVPAAPHGPRPNSAAAAVAAIGAGMPNAAGRPSGIPASARGPVASQPGVSFTESVAESTPEERPADS
jgi:hypothetical protein